jgi:hypothetical protein
VARIAEQDYAAEEQGALTGRQLQGMTQDEVRTYNLDYDRLID